MTSDLWGHVRVRGAHLLGRSLLWVAQQSIMGKLSRAAPVRRVQTRGVIKKSKNKTSPVEKKEHQKFQFLVLAGLVSSETRIRRWSVGGGPRRWT